MIEISQYLFYKLIRLINVINLNNTKIKPVSNQTGLNYKKYSYLS